MIIYSEANRLPTYLYYIAVGSYVYLYVEFRMYIMVNVYKLNV